MVDPQGFAQAIGLVVGDSKIVEDEGCIRQGADPFRELEPDQELLGSALILELPEENVACCGVEVEGMMGVSFTAQAPGFTRGKELEASICKGRGPRKIASNEVKVRELLKEIEVLFHRLRCIKELERLLERLPRRVIIPGSVLDSTQLSQDAEAIGGRQPGLVQKALIEFPCLVESPAFFLELPDLLQKTTLHRRGWVMLEGLGINCQSFLHSTRAAKLRACSLGSAGSQSGTG